MIERLKKELIEAIEVTKKGIAEFEKLGYTASAQVLKETLQMYNDLLAELES